MTTVRRISAILAVVLLSGCGGGDSEAAGSGSTSSNPCDLLTPAMIEAAFPDAGNVEQTHKDRTYPYCVSTFPVGDARYRITLTLAAGKGGASNLERAVSVFDQRSAVEGLGDGAYYVDAVHQVSVWTGDDLFHLALEQGNSGNRSRAVSLAREIVKRIE